MAITLGTDTAGECAVLFGDTDARHRGAVKYQHSTDAMLFDVNGSSEKLRLASAGQIGIGGANYGTSGQVLTSAGASAAPSWADTVGGPAWTLKTAAYTAVTGDGVMVDTDSSAITITLPASASLGDFVRIMDATGAAATNNITVGRAGHNIQGAAADLTIATNRAAIGLVYVNATEGWVLIEN